MKEGWEAENLGDLCKLVRGPFGGSLKKAIFKPSGYAVYEQQHAINDQFEQFRYFVDEKKFGEMSRFEVASGDLIMSCSGTMGKVAIVPDDAPEGIINQALLKISPGKRLDANFLRYWMDSPGFQEQLSATTMGVAIKNVASVKTLKAMPIPLPPLEEQQRIVAVLDEAFEVLAHARTHAEANLQNAREFFPSVLRSVFSNDSRKWETNLTNDLVASKSEGKKAKKGKAGTQTGGRGATLRPIPGDFSLSVLPMEHKPRTGWKWTQLTDLARLESGHTPSRKKPEYWGGDVPWIGIKDARDHHGKEVVATLENTNSLGIANSSARILPAKTVCLSRTASVGYVTVMGTDMATSQDFVNWVCGDSLYPEFLKFLLLAQGDGIRRFASGSVHQTIYFPEVKAFHICHPPVAVQEQVCTALEAVRDESDGLVDFYSGKLQDLDDLRQSLLQKAFAGELSC